MKRALLFLLCIAALAPALRAADEPDASGTDSASTAGGVSISPDSGNINPGDILTISFPTPMVSPDRIDMGGATPPFVAKPRLDGTFLWKSQTEGEFTISAVVAGATHHCVLAPHLKDADGHPFSVPAWSVDYTTPTFAISTDWESKDDLASQPLVVLNATYAVDLAEVAKHAWIQDRDSRAHFPVDIVQTGDGPPVSKEFEVEPRDPLPPNHTYDLLIEGLKESVSHQALPYPAVVPLGDTHDLKIEWVGGFNQALDQPTIIVKFNDSIPPEAVKDGMVQITPDVPGLHIVANEDELDLTGNFDLTQRYHVTISPDLKGERGYGLPGESRWFASFPARQPSLSFPGPRLYLRGHKELRFAFLQSHTPGVTWHLAKIPLEKLPAVDARLDEYNQSEKDPLTGGTIYDPKTDADKEKQTELLVKAFDLPIVLSGSCDAADAPTDTLREVKAPLPDGVPLEGPYLIEASSTLPDGRIAGGRTLVFFSDYIVTQKRSPGKVFVRVAKMEDAMPVAGITIRAVTDQNIELARAVTDDRGIATFPHDPLFPKTHQAYLFIADTPAGPSLGVVDESTYSAYSDSGSARPARTRLIITDRNLYRPGEEVKIKGILRERDDKGALAIPQSGKVHWDILQGDDGKVIGQGDADLNADGAFAAAWPIPATAALGNCTLDCTLDGNQCQGNAEINIQEYRVPLFTVAVDAATESGVTAHARVSSALFHGGANAGAHVHWKATWTALAETGTDETVRYNAYSRLGPVLDRDNELTQSLEGDAVLDAQGMATLASDSPFKANAAVGSSEVNWQVDVTSVDGETLSGGASANFSSASVLIGVSAEEKMTDPRGISVKLDAVDPDGNTITTTPVNVTVDLYHVTTRTVKEQVAPFVYKYHNDDQYTKVDSSDATAPGSLVFSATTTGNYIIGVHARDIQTPLVSTDATVTGDEPAEMPVENDTSFGLTTRDEAWNPGDKAVFTVAAPYAGVAWVCVETDDILDSMVVPLAGNAGRIEIPVKKEYSPNATLSVYLTRPGGADELPVERFAIAPFKVKRPDLTLILAAHMDKAEVRPGQTVHGQVSATVDGKPVSGADLAVFAVDDAVLKLGDWTLPDALATFYPDNPYSISNYQSLDKFTEEITGKKGPNGENNFQKGFVIGDGGDDMSGKGNALRKEFRTLAFWNASLKTGADGTADFQFTAPDNLTSYRIVTIGQTRDNQFGGDAAQTVKINKPLMVDPALPRFLRDGDQIELRAVVRQNFADSAQVTARCIPGDGCVLTGTPSLTGTAAKDAPWVLRFAAKVTDPDLKSIKVRFEAAANSDPSMSDAVEVTIPVSAPTIVRHETASGTATGPGFNAPALMPAEWTGGRGDYTLTLSTSSWLPAIAGIPTILDYPHGCFEQITSKLLCYSLLANLMDYLPDTASRLGAYNVIFQQGIQQINSGLLSDGRLPYWPGGTEGDDFVTCQACWALNEAASAGFDIPEGLTDKLAKAVKTIASGSGDNTTRAFALYVLVSMKADDDYASIADDIYLHRINMEYDGRALLAMAMHQANIMPAEKLQLLAEVDKTVQPTAFKPATFGSMDRTEGIVDMAFESISPPTFTDAKKAEIRKRLLHVMDSASLLSTQENLWLLLAFKSMLDAQPSPALEPAQPAAATVSKNGASAAWTARKLGDPFVLSGLNKSAMTFLMQGEYSLPQLDTPRVDRGFRVERVVHNLTNGKRTGTPDAPYRIGDQLLVTYRVHTDKQQYYVALEDSLPAAFETVNPDLAQVGKFFDLPPVDPGDTLLDLSHSEMRDRSTLLYFDEMAPGSGVYSILARVTAAGTFRWPATQVTPMYDSRFSGLSASGVCSVSAQ
jgi:uncharacterized protein YfaS (alpha-2-macroglobulin family)